MPGQVPTKVLPEQHTIRLQDAVPGHILSRIPEMKTGFLQLRLLQKLLLRLISLSLICDSFCPLFCSHPRGRELFSFSLLLLQLFPQSRRE